jgi:hypothetical protein
MTGEGGFCRELLRIRTVEAGEGSMPLLWISRGLLQNQAPAPTLPMMWLRFVQHVFTKEVVTWGWRLAKGMPGIRSGL